MHHHLLLCALLLLAGCGARDLATYDSQPPTTAESVVVHFDCQLERSFVRSNSNLGAGAAAMWIIAGPFSQNIVHMHGQQQTADGFSAQGGCPPWRKRLSWGDNQWFVYANPNQTLSLSLRTGGTREGMVQITKLPITSEPNQNYCIKLGELGAEITKQ